MEWYKRSAWTLEPTKCTAKLDPSRVKGVAIHYPGGNIPELVAAGNKNATAQYLRGVRASQMASTKYSYCDIEYNLAVDRKGNVWDLRGIELRGGANGTSSSNESHVSVFVLVGLTENREPTPEQVEGIRMAVRRVRLRYPGASDIKPHSAFVATACPGKPLHALIASGELDPRISRARVRLAKVREAIRATTAKLAKLRARETQLDDVIKGS